MVDIGIGRLAELTGVKIPTIRFYEQNDLVPPPARTKGGQRRYDERAVRDCTLSAMRATLALASRISANSWHCPNIPPCRATLPKRSRTITYDRSRGRSLG